MNKEKRAFPFYPPVFIIITVLFIILLGGVTWVAVKRPFVFNQIIETNINTVIKEILPASEYVCLVYNYQSISQRTYNPGSWINERNILIVLDGTIKLGFNCSEIELNRIGTRLILKMPGINVLAHEQYPERAKSYDLAGGGLFPGTIRPQEILDLLGDSKLEQQRNVEENEELLKQARESTEELFRPLLELNPLIKNQYTVAFQW